MKQADLTRILGDTHHDRAAAKRLAERAARIAGGE